VLFATGPARWCHTHRSLRAECPATAQWTWTDEARADALRAVATESDAPGDHALNRVLDALAPHVARQVAALTAEVERLHLRWQESYPLIDRLSSALDRAENERLALCEERRQLRAEVERLRTITEAARDTRFPDGEVYVSYEMYDHALTLCVEAETERDALRRQVDVVKALHRPDGPDHQGRERCYHCHFAYPCPTYTALATSDQLERFANAPAWDGEPGGTAPWGVQD
jgi:hypothetical protein